MIACGDISSSASRCSASSVRSHITYLSYFQRDSVRRVPDFVTTPDALSRPLVLLLSAASLRWERTCWQQPCKCFSGSVLFHSRVCCCCRGSSKRVIAFSPISSQECLLRKYSFCSSLRISRYDKRAHQRKGRCLDG